jgi:hypothetical protein
LARVGKMSALSVAQTTNSIAGSRPPPNTEREYALSRKTTDCNDETVPAEATLTLIRTCPGSRLFGGLSAFASRAAQTVDIQSMQFMLLDPIHLDHYHAAHRAIGLLELIEAQ